MDKFLAYVSFYEMTSPKQENIPFAIIGTSAEDILLTAEKYGKGGKIISGLFSVFKQPTKRCYFFHEKQKSIKFIEYNEIDRDKLHIDHILCEIDLREYKNFIDVDREVYSKNWIRFNDQLAGNFYRFDGSLSFHTEKEMLDFEKTLLPSQRLLFVKTTYDYFNTDTQKSDKTDCYSCRIVPK